MKGGGGRLIRPFATRVVTRNAGVPAAITAPCGQLLRPHYTVVGMQARGRHTVL
jgi:hypothetical protein